MSKSKPSLSTSEAKVSYQDRMAVPHWGYAQIFSGSNPVTAATASCLVHAPRQELSNWPMVRNGQ